MKITFIITSKKWILFLFVLFLTILSNSNKVFSQAAIANPAGTTVTTLCTADSRAIGFPNGNTFTYANTAWAACTAWGFSSTAGIPVCRANVLASSACAWDNVTYNAAAPTNLAGGVMCFIGTTNYRASNGSTTYGNVLTNIRMVVTVTDNSGNPMQLQVSGGYVYVVIPDPSFTFKAKVELQAQGPAGVYYFTTGTGTTVPIGCTTTPNNSYTCASYLAAWVGVIQLYNCISTESTYQICTQFTGSTFLSAGVPTAPPTPTTSAATICTGGTPTLSRGVGPPAAPTSGITWYWQTGSPTGTDVTNSGATLAVTPASTTTYYLRPRVGTCWGTASPGVTVTVVADPAATTPTITPATVCAGNGSTVFSSNGSLGITPYTFTWQYDNAGTYGTVVAGTPPASTYVVAGTTPNSTLTVANITSPGTYNYRLRVTGGTGCAGNSAPTTLTVVADPTAPTLNVATPANGSTICIGGTVNATFNTSSNGTGTCTNNYRSSIDGGTTWLAYTPPANLTAVTAGANRIQIQSNRTCDGSGCDGTGETFATVVQWTVVADPTVTTQPVAATICSGGTRVLTAAITAGTGLTYQWEQSTDNITFVNEVGGTGGTTLSYTTAALTANLYHRLRVNSGVGCTPNPLYSTAVLTTVVADPTLTAPASNTVCVGASQAISTVAAGGTSTFTYQWQYSSNGTSGWANTSNGTPTGITYTTPTAATMTIVGGGTEIAQIAYYRCVLNSTTATIGCNATSANSVHTIVADPVAQTITATYPTGTTLCLGGQSSATFSGGSGGTGTITDVYEVANVTANTWVAYTPGTLMTFNTAGTPFGFRTRRTATGTGCTASANTTVTYTVVLDPSIGTQPVAGTICSGGSRTLTATVNNGTGLVYQWEESNDNGVGDAWANVVGGSGAATLSYTTPALTANLYHRLRVNSTGGGCLAPIYTNSVLTTVVADPALTTPAANAVCIGGSSVTATSTVSGGTGTFSYQWQYSSNGTSGWANVVTGTPTGITYTNPTTATVTIAGGGTEIAQIAYYRCVLSTATPAGAGCDAISGNYVHTINPDPVAQTVNSTIANGSTVCIGAVGSATFSGGSGGAGTITDTYEKADVTSNTWVAYTAGTATTFNTAGAIFGFRTRRSATGSGCATTANNTVSFIVVADPTVSTQPVAGTICSGGTRTLTAVTSNGTGTITYQWEESNDNGVGDPWADVVGGSGATTLSYTTPALTANLYHRLRVNSTGAGCTNPGYSNAVLTTVVADPTVTITGSADVCVGSSVVLTATPAGGSGALVTYNWERSPAGLGTWTSVQNTTTATYPTSTALTAGVYDYRVTYTQNVSGCAVTSSIFQVTVSSPDIAIAQVPTVTATPTTICSGDAVTVTATGLVPGGQGSNTSGVITLAGSQYVRVTYPVNNSLQTPGDFTYEMWVRPTSWTTLNTYFSNGLWNGQSVLFRQDNSTTINLYISNVTIGSLTYAPPLNVWTHLALVRSGATIGLYANGCRVGNFTTNYATSITPTTDLVIGASTHALTESWRGQIDNFRLWKGVALPVTTMNSWRTLQASASHPNWANLSCEYRFNGDYTNSGPAGGSGTGVMTGGGFAAPTCYTYTWTGSGTWTTSGAPAGSTNEVQTANPTNTTGAATTGSYTVIASRSGYTSSPVSAATATITVNPLPAAPTAVSASPTSFCIAANTIQLNATAAGSTIYWYTVASGGANIGTSASGANFTVSPVATTTYYAEARNNTTSCISATRTSVTVTLVATPGTSSPIEGTTTICVGATSTLSSPLATGGNITETGGYRIHAFYSNGTLNIANAANVEILVVAGGGGGGGEMGGGGGGGGVIANSSYAVVAGSYAITVGTGGKGANPGDGQLSGSNGGDSKFGTLLTAVGGGGGGSNYNNNTQPGRNGGSGGGCAGYLNTTFGLGTAGQGNNGGASAGQYYPSGGGGAGGAGSSNLAHGGNGVSNSILGTAYYWGGGGGGAGYTGNPGNGGLGGAGGGAPKINGFGLAGGSGFNPGLDGQVGTLVAQTNVPAGHAGANTGSGGGGGSHYNVNNPGGSGGSGIVVLRYLDVSANGTWSSSTPGVATVNPATGVVTAVAPGTTTISFTGTNGICTASAPVTTVVTVLALPSPPTSADVAICAGGTANINATSTGNLIKWYNAPTGGTLVGVTASGVNLPVTPGSTTTYYAEAVANNPYATGGTVTTFGSYRIHRFNATANGPLVVVKGGNMEVLVVGGGGGGGTNMGGGGGAGGVIINNSFPVAAGSFTTTVGTGGAGAPAGVCGAGCHPTVGASNGISSVFSSLTAIGGGRGGNGYNTQGLGNNLGNPGGSGGGANGYNNDGIPQTGGAGTAGQGYRGGNQGVAYFSGGGGGASGPGGDGNNAPHGGPGIPSSILGTEYYFGGGGGGSGYSNQGGNGGKGGGGGGAIGLTLGGNGGINPGIAGTYGSTVAVANVPGGNAGANTGGGGGGGSHQYATNKGGDGGSGIIVVRYIDAGCSSATRTPVVVTVNPLPIDIVPTAAAATVCNNTGTNIQIASSQTGVDYQLRNNAGNINVGSAVAGTGGTINLPTGNLTATTTFNVLATNPTTTCFRQMTTTVTVTVYTNLTGGAFVFTNPTSCTASNGTVTITAPTGGSGTYNYSINSTDGSNGTWQASTSFTGIADAASGTVWVRNAAVPYCAVNLGTFTMQEPYEPIPAPFATNSLANLCSSNIATLTASTLSPGVQHGVFNGSSYVTLTTGAPLTITGSQTIEMWLYPTDFSLRRNPYAKAYGGEGTITQELNGTLNYYYGTAGANTTPFQSFGSGASLPINTWSHIAIVRDLSAMTLKWYINGNQVATTAASYAAATASALTAYIGTGYTNPYSGNIEGVRIWSVARTTGQIQADMYLADPTVSTGLVANYKFNGDFTGAPSGPTGTNTGVTFAAHNFYTYTWTGAVPGGSNPTPSTLEVQTTGPLTGTSPFQVTASHLGCNSIQSNTVPSNDFGGAYTVALEAAGAGNAVNVVLPGNSTGTTYGIRQVPPATFIGAETSSITASGGGAWDRCVNWGLPVVSTATYGPRIGFGAANTSMTYLAQGQANSTTNLANGIVCFTANVTVPASKFCTDAACATFLTGTVLIRITLTTLTPGNTIIPLDYTSSGHIVMRAAQNFKLRQLVEIQAPTATYYGAGVSTGSAGTCNNYSTPNAWYPILEWYDCIYKAAGTPQFYYSFNYNSFPKFTFTSSISAGSDFSVCVGGQPSGVFKLQGDLGSLSATCGTLQHYWSGPGGYSNAGTLLAPTGVEDPGAITAVAPTTFGTYNYTVSQGPAATSNICYGTDAVVVSQNIAVVDGSVWANGAVGTTYYGTAAPAYLDPATQVTGADSWYDNRNWDHCVPDASTNALIKYNATNPANINSNVVGYWGANAKTKFLKIDVPNNAKLIINANGTTKLNVTD